jgi:hypothetical protein
MQAPAFESRFHWGSEDASACMDDCMNMQDK